jgi:predicted secreted protein
MKNSISWTPCRAVARWTRSVAAGLALSTVFGAAQAGEPAEPLRGIVNLTASASAEVEKDWLSVSFSTAREGSDAASVQSALKQALDAALQEARRVAQPGQVQVQAGRFSVTPRYSSKGGMNGWQGQVELVVEGRDMATIGQLSGRITTLTLGRVSYGLSREQREGAEGRVTEQAIARYRAKAAEAARHFGYTGYTVREVSVTSNDASPGVPMMRARAMSASADEALPIEAGQATVTVTVNGSVAMTR